MLLPLFLSLLLISITTTIHAEVLAQSRCGITLDPACSKSSCYVMLPHPPYIIVSNSSTGHRNNDSINLSAGFKCVDGAQAGVDGILVRLMSNLKIWNGAEKCYIGHGCTFDDMVAWVAKKGSRMIMVGAMIRTPKRRVMQGAMMGVSLVDDQLVVVGKRKEDKNAGLGRAWALLSPLDDRVWLAAAGCLALCVVAVVILKYSRSLFEPQEWESQQRSRGERTFHWIVSIVGSVGAVFGIGHFTSSPSETYTNDRPRRLSSVSVSGSSRRSRTSWRLALYNLTVLLFSFFLAFFLVVWVLFYQAALTNFLFQESESPLARPVRSMRDLELKNYLVLNNSGVSEAWLGLQRQNTLEYKPWQTCASIQECFDRIRSDQRTKLVIQEAVAKYHIFSQSLCQVLTIFKSNEILYKFNAGLIYGPLTDEGMRKKIDEEFLKARLSDTIRETSQEFLTKSKCFQDEKAITWKVYIVPTLLINSTFVMLILAQVVLMRWK